MGLWPFLPLPSLSPSSLPLNLPTSEKNLLETIVKYSTEWNEMKQSSIEVGVFYSN